MPLAAILADFRADVLQCDNLIANAHRLDAAGAPILPAIDQQQITVAALLNMFIAWETFLEASLLEFMTGAHTLNGNVPVKYVNPVSIGAARELVAGYGRKFFDYGNHGFMRELVGMFFQNGYPYEPHLSSINADLDDLRTMRNSSAHITSNTQTSLGSLALRIFGQPHAGIDLYRLMTMVDPRSAAGGTVFVTYRDKLSVTAELIVRG